MNIRISDLIDPKLHNMLDKAFVFGHPDSEKTSTYMLKVFLCHFDRSVQKSPRSHIFSFCCYSVNLFWKMLSIAQADSSCIRLLDSIASHKTLVKDLST